MWFWYGLLSAIVSAFSVTINKKVLNNVHARLLSWSLFAFPIPILFYIVIKGGNVSYNSNFLIGVTASAFSFAVAKTITLDSIKKGILSRIYPLVSLGPLFTYFFGIIFLSEQIKLSGFLGLLCIAVGLYILNIEQAQEGLHQPFKYLFTDKASLLFISGILLSSLTAIFDKMALVNTNPKSPALTLLLENLIMSILLLGYLTHKDKKWFVEVKNNFSGLLIASTVYMILALIIFLGFISGPVALVHGVKKLEVIFVLVLGSLLFGDKPARGSWISASIMIGGVILLKLY